MTTSHFSPKSYSNPHHDKFNTTSSSIDQDLEALQRAILEHASDSTEEYTDRLRRLENIIIQKDLNFRTEMKRMADIKQENLDLELELGQKKDEIKRLEQALNDAEWQSKNEIQALKRQHLEEIAELKEINTQDALRASQDMDRASKRVHDQQKKVIEALEADLRQRDIDIRDKDETIKRKEYEIDLLNTRIAELQADLEPMEELRKQTKKLTRKVAQLTAQKTTETEKVDKFETTIESMKEDQEKEILNITHAHELQMKILKEHFEKEFAKLNEELATVNDKQKQAVRKEYEILIEGYESRLKRYSEQEKEIAEVKSLFEEALEREKKLKKMIFETHMEQESMMKEREAKALTHMKSQMHQLKTDLEDALQLIKEKDLKLESLQAELKQYKQQIAQLEEGWKRDRASQDLLAKSQELLNHSIEKLKNIPHAQEETYYGISNTPKKASFSGYYDEPVHEPQAIHSSQLNSSILLNTPVQRNHSMNHSMNQSMNQSGSFNLNHSSLDDLSRTIDSLRNENQQLRSENQEIKSTMKNIQLKLETSPSSDVTSTASKMQETIRKLKKDLRAAEFSSRAKQRLIDLCLSDK